MRVQFCGAAQEVTGSAHLITLDNGFKILLDCGLYQGRSKHMKDFNGRWHFKPSELDCVILSHAHIDHSGRLPKLIKDGFKGTIFSTHATRSLCSIMLLDSALIQERDAAYYNKQQRKKGQKGQREALYTKQHVVQTMGMFCGQSYNRWFSISEQVDVLFKDAGHILGSANVTLRIKEEDKTTLFGFSGDIGRPNRPILRDPQPMPEVDYLICESTYGDREHLGAPSELESFLEVIHHTCVEKKGKLIIPAFSVGRTQEIVYMLDQLETAGKLPHIPVYVDSPLAVNATQIFGAHPECFDNDLNEYLLIDDNPFGFNSLNYVRQLDISKSLNTSTEACIIISSSGMMNAGRVKHHLFHSIDKEQNTILIVGYCSPGTPGGKLRAGAEEIKLFGKQKPVKAEIKILDSFSAHADQLEILDFIKNQKGRVQKIFLVHGTLDRQQKLKEVMETFGVEDVQIPSLAQEYKL